MKALYVTACAVLFGGGCTAARSGSLDAGADGTASDGKGADSSKTGADASAEAGCSPEGDAQFCTRIGKSCEMVSGTDNCGAPRTANCGTCPTGMGCVDQVCRTPVCTTFNNYAGTLYSAGSRAGLEDAVITSSNGQTIVYGQAPGTPACGTFNVYVSDEMAPGSTTYIPRDLTQWVTSHLVITNEMAMSGDGLTLVVLATGSKSFASAQRSALQVIDFGTPSTADFAAINGFVTGTTGVLGWPVLSPDGREFYYSLGGISPAVNGIYRSIRPSGAGAFPVGSLVSVLSAYQFVTAVSSDRLTLFAYTPYAGFVFTRASTSAEFTNPSAPNTPPQLPGGWQQRPFQDCKTIFSMAASAGGCANEDLYFNYQMN
jgi:hypothetical protein